MSKLPIRGLTLEHLEEQIGPLNLEPYRARQIFSWVHGRGLTDTAGMTNLSKEARARLALAFSLDVPTVDAVQRADDGTRKLRLRLPQDQALIETVLIPAEGKVTQCLSSQVGCGLGCRFCATASMGLSRSLTTDEIVSQVYAGQEQLTPEERISNLVFMGMGEPMNNLDSVLEAVQILCTDLGANFSPRRITISTAGLVPGIRDLGRRMPQVGLAISLNATTDEVRNRLMPINRRYPLKVLMEALRRYPLPRRRRITFEYVLIRDLNDTDADAKQIPVLLHGIKSKVNLIPYNPCPDDKELGPPTPERVETFAEGLRQHGLTTVVRRSRGAEIAAACGQLVTQK